jgi:hypothetical protein
LTLSSKRTSEEPQRVCLTHIWLCLILLIETWSREVNRRLAFFFPKLVSIRTEPSKIDTFIEHIEEVDDSLLIWEEHICLIWFRILEIQYNDPTTMAMTTQTLFVVVIAIKLIVNKYDKIYKSSHSCPIFTTFLCSRPDIYIIFF